MMNSAAESRSETAAGGFLTPAEQGLKELGPTHRNQSVPILVEQALRRDEGVLTRRGALVFRTGKYTGRSPKDKYIVREPSSADQIDWGAINQPFEPEKFDALHRRVLDYLKGREVWIEDAFGGTDPIHRLPIRVICERVYHALFSHQLFVRPEPDEAARHRPEFTIVSVPDFKAVPERDGTRSETFIIVHFAKRIVLIGGTCYAGEIKKSVFTILNYLLPLRGVLSMHCSANVGARGDTALFFGLSGTGKTTLSADTDRHLIGDDEHGWSEEGVFNFEGGCYAKCIRLNRFNEPEIFEAIRFGTVLENVGLDPQTREVDFADSGLTENTRAAYPIEFIPNYVPGGRGGHPENIIFLTCDAFGVLPPLSRLTPEQAMYHYLSGYTAKVAGTERGLGQDPEAVFSSCFGAPFLPLPPRRYADLLGQKLRRHRAEAWLLNTGWTGGGFGEGERISLMNTRALVDSIMSGSVKAAEYAVDPIFGLRYPVSTNGLSAKLLNPRSAWRDPAAYDRQARRLADLFRENFKRYPNAGPEIQAAGPKV